MFKTTVKSKDAQLGIGDGWVMPEHIISNLVGELLTLVEVLGLKPEQEKSLKDLIKQKVWGSTRDMNFVESPLLTAVQSLVGKIRHEQRSREVASRSNSDVAMPMSYIKGEYEITFTEDETE